MRWHVNVRFILCHQMTKAIIKSYIVYAKKPWNNIHGFSYIYIFFSITIQRHQHLQMCVSILSCVNTHDKPAADTYAHSHGYNSLRSLYHVLRHMISLRLIPMRIRADIIRLRSLYHVLRHMISLRLIPMRIRADIIRLRSLYLMFQNCILIQCYDCMCIFQRKSMYLISVLRFLHNILSLMFLH